jgi:hypothetical protein
MTARCRWFTRDGASRRTWRNAAVGVQVGEGPKSTQPGGSVLIL